MRVGKVVDAGRRGRRRRARVTRLVGLMLVGILGRAHGAVGAAVPRAEARIGFPQARESEPRLRESGALSDREVERGNDDRAQRMRQRQDDRRARKRAELDAWLDGGRPVGSVEPVELPRWVVDGDDTRPGSDEPGQ